MDRSKIILSSIAGVTVIAVLVFAFLGFQAGGRTAEAIESRDQSIRSIEKVYRQDNPFPSKENVAAVRVSADRMAMVRGGLTNALASRNLPSRNLSPSVFVQLLRKIATAKIENAPIVDGKKVVEPNFTFGFDRYIGLNPSMPKEEDVSRLLQQLYVVDEIVDVLYSSHVARLLSVERELFDAAAVVEEAAPRRGARRPGKKAKKAEKKQDARSHQHFTVKFMARQEAAVAFVNGLSKLKHFVWITDITFQKAGADIRLPGGSDDELANGSANDSGRSRSSRSSRRRRAEREDDAEAALSGTPIVSKLPPGQRLMSGAEIDPLITVTVEFDIYTFAKGGK